MGLIKNEHMNDQSSITRSYLLDKIVNKIFMSYITRRKGETKVTWDNAAGSFYFILFYFFKKEVPFI